MKSEYQILGGELTPLLLLFQGVYTISILVGRLAPEDLIAKWIGFFGRETMLVFDVRPIVPIGILDWSCLYLTSLAWSFQAIYRALLRLHRKKDVRRKDSTQCDWNIKLKF